MCTVLTLDNENLFGRTMDFPPRTPWKLTFLPAGYQWLPATNNQSVITDQYAILGGMRVVDDHYLIGDAINEKGLVCAELFFPVAASYGQLEAEKQLLTPQDFIHWVLASHATVRDVIADLDNVVVVKERWFDGQQYPFHWLLMDDTGTYGIEPLDGKLVVFKNTIGVYTNTPAFPEQVAKMNSYLGNDEGTTFTELTKRGLEHSTAAIDGRNSSERFILAARTRWGSKITSSDELKKFLSLVTIPKNEKHAHNYTHYQAIIDRQSGEYHFHNQLTGEVTTFNVKEHATDKKIRRL
ncbi:MAG: linear amide C-N hydrolase [Candidatus Limosilactobacillus merdavium]|uniref:Linear amide C-N hydrolase n=1 Tax=Candidatus Limosilactobacillus merdavium TaxID=2838651 RepID=A0A9E2KTY3_9LACO|nr:linear amide C-N hydrolase [Candidatus Limosilactobacillus merdavium]